MLYPLNVDLTGQLVIVIGGGRVAERKVVGILAARTCGRAGGHGTASYACGQ